MATAVEVPKLGNTVEECLVSSWVKHRGDTVAAGDVIAEIETDKTSFEITAPIDGVILETFFPEGALVPVFTTICAIGAPGESAEGLSPAGAPGAVDRAGDDMAVAVPAAGPAAGPGATAGEGPVVAQQVLPAQAAVPVGSQGVGATAPLSPRARRFAREHDFYPQAVLGTGPEGRVLEEDLRRLWHSAGTAGPPTAGPPTAGPPTAEPSAVAGPAGADAPVRMSQVRERIARRLRESLASTAQYTLHTSANAGSLLALRRRMKASAQTQGVNINDLVVFCTVRALLEVPGLNAELIDGAVHRYAQVHMGFACDTPRGLVVPVIRDSQDLSVVGLSRRSKELAERAVQGSITVDDLNGGTFTVSNLGSLGIEAFTPLINPPQVAVLGVGAIGLKPVRKPDGNIEFIDSIGLSLTLDHQVVDGAPGARFLVVLRDKIENAEQICTI